MLAESKSDKSRVTSEVFQRVQNQNPPGRFLQKVADGHDQGTDAYHVNGWWVEIDDIKALAKISQALREGAPAFRAMHGKKSKKQQQQSQSAQRKSARRSKQRKRKSSDSHEVTPGDKRKEPPELSATPPPPPLPTSHTTPESMHLSPLSALPMSSNGRELDVLFPTSNNMFATESGNGTLLSSYPLVHHGDYTASINDVARAIPTPPTTKKSRPSVPATDATSAGKWSSPKFLQAPNTPFVSPGFSPYGEAKAAWDAIAFLPNLSPTSGNHSPPRKQPSLQRVHSLSFSDDDVSVGSFENPFESNNVDRSHKQEPPRLPDMEVPNQRSVPNEDAPAQFPPPLPTPPHGLSFGKIDPLPGGGGVGGNHLFRLSSRGRRTSRGESSVSSRSWGSISNLNNKHKRKSVS